MIRKNTLRNKTLDARITKLERKLRSKNEESWEHKKQLLGQVLKLVKQLNGFERLDKEMRDFAKSYAKEQAEDDWYDDDGYIMDGETEDFGEEIRDLLTNFVNSLDYESIASEIIYDHMNT